MGIVNYVLLFSLFGLFLLLAIYSLFHKRKGFYYWFLVTYLLFGFILHFSNFKYGLILGFIAPMFLAIFESLLISWEAYKKGKRNVLLLVFGIGAYLLLYFTFILNMYGVIPRIDVLPLFDLSNICYHLSNIVITLSFSFHLSREFGFTTKDLERKLQEVQHLSEEKQQILATQNEKLEKQVTERTAELNNSLEKLKSTQTQLIQSEKLASLGELTAGIAHEIQNPLNFVNNFSELSVDLVKDLKDEINKPDIDKEYVGELFTDLSQNQEKINHHGKRASSIVKGMLEHSRASTGVKELTDINKLADEYLRLSYHGLRAKDNSFNADFKTEFDPTLPKIEVIPQDMGRVLLNLINNAFYAVNQRKLLSNDESYAPSVSISTKQLENAIEIRVKDNGIGMPESIRAKVFQPFFTTKPTGQGTGLGLSLAYDIVTKGHGGTLEVVSTVTNPDNGGEGVGLPVRQAGSEFIITLPFKTNLKYLL